MRVKVSVVVPVRNPGDAADACIRSVLEQSLPQGEYEVIFADTGSVDGIAERLDSVSAVRPNVRVLHLQSTDSIMRARNVGLAVAQGEYVYLLEQGDRLDRGALRRMYLRAVETDADVLIGRLVRGQGPPQAAFAGSRERADVVRDKLFTLLTPQKLYRKEFLTANALRFDDPGGKVAEQAFAVRALLTAKAITVLADQVCCHLGEPPEPAPTRPVDTAAELRALLDIVDAHTEPGRQRDRLYAHWLRTVVLRSLMNPRFVTSSHERYAVYAPFRALVTDRFPEEVDTHLPVHLRAMAALLRAGRLDQIVTLARASRGTTLAADLCDVRWENDILVLRLDVEVVGGGGAPQRFRADGDRVFWQPPVPLDPAAFTAELADVTEAVARSRVEVYVRHAESGMIYMLPVESQVTHIPDGGHVRMRISGEARLDVGSAAIGNPLPAGLWNVHVRMYGGAHHARTRVRRGGMPINCLGVLVDHPRRLVVPCWSDDGELGVCVEPRSFAESIALVSFGASVTQRDGQVYVVVPVPYVPPSGGPPVELVLRHVLTGREVAAPALVEPGVPGRLPGQLVAKLPVRRLTAEGFLGPGGWTPTLRIDGEEEGLRFGIHVRRGHAEVRPSSAVDAAQRPLLERDSILRRVALRIPGARHVARAARKGRSRYL
ncbi:Glycosyl transferase family 2 [Sinosporangium album]|uniref:Glycosyl transferase family 2 n=1 Tax=Sinosporangium album TaxID=504805 RepID=A0A1G7XY39_9ACTN|nr:glycosyltransferase [Sinosporangium album]SDG89099.1 Glycosyl transferase family 2 [Sinosporangium album]